MNNKFATKKYVDDLTELDLTPQGEPRKKGMDPFIWAVIILTAMVLVGVFAKIIITARQEQLCSLNAITCQ